MPEITVLRKRADFVLAAASGFKCVKPFIIIQVRKRTDKDIVLPSEIRVGFTATKMLGNAIVRNRTKRRMRAAAAKLLPELGLPGHDYVFVGRSPTRKCDFDVLLADMRSCLKRFTTQASGIQSHK